VAAIDAYMRDPEAGPYRFSRGHSLDIPALDREEFFRQFRPQEKALRTRVTAIVMAAYPLEP
jgi:hypothetical protein